MKTLIVPIVSLLAVVIGSTIGIVTAMNEFAHERGIEAVEAQSGSSPATVAEQRTGGEPRVIVMGESDFDFGVMERNQTMRHTFVLKNVGDAPALLEKGETTCKCTLSELAQGKVEPGQTVEVALEWTPNSFAQEFRQSATIESNDPDNKFIKLEVHGKVIQTVRPVPEQVVLSNISSNETRTATVYVYCYRPGEFDVQFDSVEDPKLEEFFAVDIEPLADELVDEEPEAQSGVKITVTVQPGMPLGPIRQTLHFTSNLEDLPKLSIPIRGTVAGDITVLASKSLYNSDLRLLTLGGVPREEGGTYRLQILVKGPFAKQTKLSVGEVDPSDVLQVEIQTDNPNSINDGAVLAYPLIVKIPPGSRPVSRLGGKEGSGPRFGKIVIETTHPYDKQVVLLVKFAVEGSIGR